MIKALFSILRILICWIGAFFLFTKPVLAQPPQIKLQFNLKNYIKEYSDEAVQQMIEYCIPASVILAQAIFESGSGTSDLAIRSKNHFGIKCHEEWLGDTITMNDDTLNECFRKYARVKDSYTDHSLFLSSRPRYADLFELSITDYQGWCYGLKNAGYATYPTYAEDLIKLIEDERLYDLDNIVTLTSKPFAGNVYKLPETIFSSKLNTGSFNLKDFSKDGIIWLDEKDVLVQSIDMIVDSEENEELVLNSK